MDGAVKSTAGREPADSWQASLRKIDPLVRAQQRGKGGLEVGEFRIVVAWSSRG